MLFVNNDSASILTILSHFWQGHILARVIRVINSTGFLIAAMSTNAPSEMAGMTHWRFFICAISDSQRSNFHNTNAFALLGAVNVVEILLEVIAANAIPGSSSTPMKKTACVSDHVYYGPE